MKPFGHILAKSLRYGGTTLVEHLRNVSELCKLIASELQMDASIAYKGAVLHDMGKVSPQFQQTLKEGFQRPPGFLFRHEIASLFFISLLDEAEKPQVIDMIVAHHKSAYEGEEGATGIMDLSEQDSTFIEKHLTGFEEWSMEALEILHYFGFAVRPVSQEEARENIYEVIRHCRSKKTGYSLWKGILNASDYLASALEEARQPMPGKLFSKPDLSHYHSRQSALYPLSLICTDDARPHTLVTAPTGAGKTDFLLRRCRGRVFYTLPFQASINAMYVRIQSDLQGTEADVRLLHASSRIIKGSQEEIALQKHAGASVKVLTPHQLAILAFGVKGYEALIADLKGCDVILDEIHTYSDITQAIVLKLVEILAHIGCRLHIGTATMPTDLYNQLVDKLGGKEQIYEVKLADEVLDTFDRHILHKAESFESLSGVIEQAIADKQKILIVCNRVKHAQKLYSSISEKYTAVKRMLIHSRFKRGDRAALEKKLMEEFNACTEACLVVSTQVVEVSLDISFDLMITDCAPVDALIQRFGRINRKRNEGTIGKYKPVYVIQPVTDQKDALPYSLDVLKRSFDALPDAQLLKERNVQAMIDKVYPHAQPSNLKLDTAFDDGEWRLKELRHKKKAVLLETLDIDTVSCITDDDREAYENGDYPTRIQMEIPVRYMYSVMKDLCQLDCGSHPYLIPTPVYDHEMGFCPEKQQDSSIQLL